MELQEYRYPSSALMRDYLRAVTGLTVFGGPALFVPLSSVMFALLGGLGLLFAAFALRTFLRQQSRLLADDRGLRFAGPVTRQLAWSDIEEVRLKYYSTWRDRTSGWMQLGVKGKGTTIRIDQTIEGFEHIAKTTFVMALKQGVTLDAGTLQNAGALGLALPQNVGERAE